jgi:hypothetical protein
MAEVFENPHHIPLWHDAAQGRSVDWNAILAGYSTAVDWPAAAFWRELSDEHPDAKILLSFRDPEDWWASASATIFRFRQGPPEMDAFFAMVQALFENRFVADIDDKDACIAAYNRLNDEVRKNADPNRLVEWSPGDGWAPLCKMLDVPIPNEPFPHSNSRDEFIARVENDRH